MWWKSCVSKAIKGRNRAWQIYKQCPSNRRWDRFKALRNSAALTTKQAKGDFERRLATKIKTNPKAYFAYAQSKGKSTRSVAALTLDDGDMATGDDDKARVLANFFGSVHREDKGKKPELTLGPCTSDFGVVHIEDEAVCTALRHIKVDKAPGPDGIHPGILKALAEVIYLPVATLFRTTLAEGKLPADWKKAIVIGIHKGGRKDQRANYRPISLTCVLCKVMESILRNQICKFFTSQGLIGSSQHGFLKTKSCLTNLLEFMDDVTNRLDSGMQVEVCYLDFSKAFDSVNHRLLMGKLEAYGISGELKGWLRDFLQNRSFKVSVGDGISEEIPVISGVPQGSVLGPLLFIIYINDLATSLGNKAFVFADDVKLLSTDRKALINDLRVVTKWSLDWDMPLNDTKCQPPIKTIKKRKNPNENRELLEKIEEMSGEIKELKTKMNFRHQSKPKHRYNRNTVLILNDDEPMKKLTKARKDMDRRKVQDVLRIAQIPPHVPTRRVHRVGKWNPT